MKRVLLYSSGIIAEEKPTGGELRFLELAGYLAGQKDAELCCADGNEALAPYGLSADVRMKSSGGTPSFLPEEARLWLANRDVLKAIAQTGYSDVIAFDVPPAIGLVLSGVRNIDLMVRKDLIGYERVKSKGSSLGKKARIAYQWLCEDLCLRRAKKVICQCDYDRDTILNRHPLQKKKLEPKFRVQINNVNPSWIEKRSRDAMPTERQNDCFRVCFIGGFDDLRKGQDLFLQAAEQLSNQHADMEFVLVGGGKRLQQDQDRYGSDRILFYGRMDNPATVLKSADLLVVPSRADSCPNTVMEALYMGIPVIGSRAGGIPEILQDDEALFETDAGAIAERVEKLCSDRDAYEALKERQRLRAQELTFDWSERIMKVILE